MPAPIVPILILTGVGLVALMGQKKKPPPGTTTPPEPKATGLIPQGIELVIPSPTSVVPSGTPPFVPTIVSPTAPSGGGLSPLTPQAVKATTYQAEVIAAIELLHYDPVSNSFNPAPSESSIQYVSGLVARMKADGFVAEAAALDKIVQAAIAVAGKPPTIVEVPSIPAALQKELDTALLYCKDPAKLRAIADALSKLPGAATNAQIQTAIQMLNQLAAQNQAQQQTAGTLQDIEVIIGPVAPSTTPAVTPPATAPTAVPKTPVETAADLMVAHLKRLQITAGDVMKSKGREDKNIVMKFQGLANLTKDGKPGPGTLVAAAGHGQYELPLVMYWPTGATKQKVYDYRAALEALALKLDSTNPSGAKSLRASAAREKGQAGIVGGALKD